MTWVLNLCFALTIMYVGFVECTFCLWGDDCYGYLSSKTPYNFIRGDIRDSVNNMQGCGAISVWTIIRHGKRNPSRYFAKKMKEAVSIRELIISSHEEGKGYMCSEDIENLRNCSIDQNIFTGIDYLTDDGYNEMFGIGDRLKDAFQTLLRNIDDDEYTIRAAFGKRMIESAKGFVEGLKNNITKVEESDSNYDLLAPYATCGKYQRDVKNSSNIYTEERRFINATDFLSVKDGIQNRLGLNYSLTTDNVIALYDLCRYTWSGFSNTRSPWCSLFTIDDLKVLEYDGDLRHYYRNGYGTPINKIFGQLPMVDLLKRFRESKQGKGKRFTGYITHATMLDMIYTALGLFEDKEPLIGIVIDPNRKWRSTFMSGFGANIISVLYRCNEENDLKVAFYQNEMPLVSMCSKGVCTWEEFETKFIPFLNANTDFCEFKTKLYK